MPKMLIYSTPTRKDPAVFGAATTMRGRPIVLLLVPALLVRMCVLSAYSDSISYGHVLVLQPQSGRRVTRTTPLIPSVVRCRR